jgi:hypothetical protein
VSFERLSLLVSLLLLPEAWINVQDRNNETPLATAIRHSRDDAAVALLDGGADPAVLSRDGSSSLYLAAKGVVVVVVVVVDAVASLGPDCDDSAPWCACCRSWLNVHGEAHPQL